MPIVGGSVKFVGKLLPVCPPVLAPNLSVPLTVNVPAPPTRFAVNKPKLKTLPAEMVRLAPTALAKVILFNSVVDTELLTVNAWKGVAVPPPIVWVVPPKITIPAPELNVPAVCIQFPLRVIVLFDVANVPPLIVKFPFTTIGPTSVLVPAPEKMIFP